jgi:DNA-binding LytR/AlgR family response regulator
MYRSLDAVMGELDGSFYRAHKSLVINISRAFGIAGDTVFFPNGQKVQLNRDACRKLKRAWFAYHE